MATSLNDVLRSGFVDKTSLPILQVSSADRAGGAEKVAWNLFQEYRKRGYPSWLAVGLKRSNDPDVLLIPNQPLGTWPGFWHNVSERLSRAGNASVVSRQLARVADKVAEPRRTIEQQLGYEDFNFPGTWQLLQLPPVRPSILHCHNLHGDYFDLRVLSSLSKQVPVVLTLHDAWMLSGHCAHSFACDRWQSGCGSCPDLTIYPAIRRDATAHNWRRKRAIYADSRLFVSTPCQWLMDRVKQSVLSAAIRGIRVIPYGIDLAVFKPQPKEEARAKLGLPLDARILLFSANRGRSSIWKDYATMLTAITDVAERYDAQSLIFLVLGDEGPSEQLGRAEIRFVPFQTDQETVASFYQAADLYLHAARADTFPNAVLEALGTGTPVVATAVGGIPEQIDDGETGFLIAPGDATEMAARIMALLTDDTLRTRMSCAARDAARQRFSLARQADDYLRWYEEILSQANFDQAKQSHSHV